MGTCADGVKFGMGEKKHLKMVGHIERVKKEEFVRKVYLNKTGSE